MPDIPDFVSPIDGQVVHGRAGLREHNRKHGVTNMADYKNEWADKAAKRAEFFTKAPDPERARDLARAFEKHRRT